MPLVIWRRKFRVGVELLDAQRVALIGVLNRFHAAMMKGDGKSIAEDSISEAMRLGRQYFACEEKLLEATGYPGLAEHRASHGALAKRLAEFGSRLRDNTPDRNIEFMHFLYHSLRVHILKEDPVYGEWLSDR